MSSFLQAELGLEQLSEGALEILQEDIAQINKTLQEHIRFKVSLPEEIGQHTLNAGGKRFRPLLVINAARSLSSAFNEHRAICLGSCMELIHMATLIHDDVIDHAATRRGQPTASILFGNTKSILTGDMLLAKAMNVLAEDGDLRILKLVSEMVLEMAEGEVYELQMRGQFELSQDQHLDILKMKTASFMRCCCQVGGIVGGASEEELNRLGEYGYHLGIAFQIIDDLLDFCGDMQLTGKPKAIDFKEGCVTLPLIFLRDHISQDQKAFVESRLGSQDVEEPALQLIQEWMHEAKAFEKAKSLALTHIQLAKTALEGLPNSSFSEVLEYFCQKIVSRES